MIWRKKKRNYQKKKNLQSVVDTIGKKSATTEARFSIKKGAQKIEAPNLPQAMLPTKLSDKRPQALPLLILIYAIKMKMSTKVLKKVKG